MTGRTTLARRVLGTLGLAALTVGTGALVVLALQAGGATPAEAGQRPHSRYTPATTTPTSPFDFSPTGGSTAQADAAASGTPAAATSPSTAAPTSGASASAGLAAAPLTRLVLAVDATHAWRVDVGSCADGGAAVATSSNGGRTWTAHDAPVKAITRLRATSARSAFVIGADGSCAASMRNTSNGGTSWTSGGGVGSSWYRDAAAPKVVHTPRGAEARPCRGGAKVVDLLPVSTARATVLCADGQVRATSDSGASWSASGSAPGALAAASDGGTDTWVARAGDQGCDGIAVVRASRPTDVIGCAKVSLTGVEPGQVALSAAGSAGWLLVGDQTLHSTDGLKTWTLASR